MARNDRAKGSSLTYSRETHEHVALTFQDLETKKAQRTQLIHDHRFSRAVGIYLGRGNRIYARSVFAR